MISGLDYVCVIMNVIVGIGLVCMMFGWNCLVVVVKRLILGVVGLRIRVDILMLWLV